MYHVYAAPTPPSGADAWLVTGGPGSIGYWDRDFVVITDPENRPADGARPLVPTVRPQSSERPTATGVVALRDFEVASDDLDEFIDLSAGAWGSFEAAFDATVLGLFRRADTNGQATELLLATRYASFAVWEQSRAAVPAQAGELAEAGRRFRRRREITLRTRVRVGPMLSAG